MKSVLNLVERIGRRTNVLITGENGKPQEVITRAPLDLVAPFQAADLFERGRAGGRSF